MNNNKIDFGSINNYQMILTTDKVELGGHSSTGDSELFWLNVGPSSPPFSF